MGVYKTKQNDLTIKWKYYRDTSPFGAIRQLLTLKINQSIKLITEGLILQTAKAYKEENLKHR